MSLLLTGGLSMCSRKETGSLPASASGRQVWPRTPEDCGAGSSPECQKWQYLVGRSNIQRNGECQSGI